MPVLYFDNPAINREYLRWIKKIGGETGADAAELSAGEVLRAHFLIAEFFADDKNGLGGIGPRDKNADLLHSALSRQDTGLGDTRKWTDNFHIAATVFFGLVKNHPFHDGNKRTALLSILHLLEKQGYTVNAEKRKFEAFVVAIADNRHKRDSLYKYFRSEKTSADDADVHYIASRLKQMMRRRDRSRRALTYRQLNGLLKRHGYELDAPNNNRINIVKIQNGKIIGHMGFPGMTKQVAKSELKKARALCGISEADGFDSKAFFNGAEGMDFLLSEYAAPLRRLADK